MYVLRLVHETFLSTPLISATQNEDLWGVGVTKVDPRKKAIIIVLCLSIR